MSADPWDDARRPAHRPRHTEQDLWHLMRDKLTRVDWDRVENSVTTGMSDLIGTKLGRVVWLELKVFKGNRIQFRPSQVAWISRRVAHGGRVYILARKDDRLILYEGKQLHDLLEAGVAAIDDVKGPKALTPAIVSLAYFITTQHNKQFDWPALENALFPPSPSAVVRKAL